MSYEGIERDRVQLAFGASTREQARQYEAAVRRADENARRRARVSVLAAALRDMLRAQPDLWDAGFNADVAAEQCLPVIQALIGRS